jgi:hypothetical protein
MTQASIVPDEDAITAVILAFEEGGTWANAAMYIRDMVTYASLVDAARTAQVTMLYLLRPEVQVAPQIREAIRQSAIQRKFICP